ncbi:MAG: DegT/DnrJ/EryC1/StrS family aminotransferase, partial [Magnetovibrio sp.]|nr:DegT/DnrJ/EryC1/StrS family aminotransferase [Magnetovibrio sp.]
MDDQQTLNATTGDDMRHDILSRAEAYAAARPAEPFTPGESYIPCSGKIVDGEDLRFLVDSCLDMHLTGGRFCDQFEAAIAEKMGIPHAALVTSGSAANLIAFSALTSPKLRAKRIQPGDEVITVAAGFPTTVGPI